MTDTQENSSLPLLLSVTGAVVAVAVGGWFLLNQQSVSTDANPEARSDEAAVATLAPVTSETAEAIPGNDAEPPGASLTADEKLNIDAELRKARLAADAEILVLPAEHSALSYYGRVLSIDPENAIAKAELDTVLAKVAQEVSQYLAAGEYDEAYEITALVARHAPTHDLVTETQATLNALTEELVQQSIGAAQAGDDEQAEKLFAQALALPGRNPDYFSAIRDSINEIRTVREAAQNDRKRRALLAADNARTAWVERTQAAIAAGNLISPAGASAKDLLAESNSFTAERAQLTREVLAALLATARTEIDGQQLGYAENLLNAATEMAGDPDDIGALRAALESALIEEKSNRVAPLSELVIVKRVPPRYPKRAVEGDDSGWVDIYFTVTPRGETADIEVSDSVPGTLFDRAAIRAIEQWKFQPVEYRGQIIAQRSATRLVFRLE